MGRGFLFIVMTMGMMSAMCSRVGDRPTKFDASRNAPGFATYDRGQGEADEERSGTGDALTLERSGDGHFYADVEINGTSLRMLVDTGASGIALSREDARRAGIATSISMPNVIGEGASGEVHGEIVTIDRISLGSASAEQLKAVVLDSGGMSLLGQDLLREFASVEIKGDRMILR